MKRRRRIEKSQTTSEKGRNQFKIPTIAWHKRLDNNLHSENLIFVSNQKPTAFFSFALFLNTKYGESNRPVPDRELDGSTAF